VVLRAPERIVTCRCCGSGTTRAARFCGRCGAGLGPDPRPHIGPDLGPPAGASADERSQTIPNASRDLRGPLVLLAALVALLWWSVTGWDQDVGVRDAEVALPTTVSSEGRVSDATAGGRSIPVGATGTATPPCETPAEPVPCIAWWHRQDPPAPPPAASRVVGSVVVTATTQGRLVGRDAFTGRQRWERPAGEGARIWPAIGGTIPVSGPRGTDLLSVSTGSPTGTFPGPLEQADSHGAWMLIVAEGRVSARLVTSARGPRPPAWELQVPAGGRAWLTSGGAYLDDGDGELRALHSNTGRERWRIAFDGRITHVVRTQEGTALGIGGPRPRVVTVARTGEVLGAVELPAELDELVVDPTGRVIAGVTEGDEAVLHLLDATTGARRLSVPLGGSGAVTPAVRSGLVAVALRRPTPTLVVLLDGGLIGLRQPLEDEPHQVVLPGGRTVIVVEGSEASAWSLVTGQRRWSVPLGSDARLVDGRALIIESAEGLTALVPDPPR
jgi:outer membrane protein assembly factor BamB